MFQWHLLNTSENSIHSYFSQLYKNIFQKINSVELTSKKNMIIIRIKQNVLKNEGKDEVKMREKKNVKREVMTITLVIAGVLIIGGTSSKAALQANPTTHSAGKTATGASWITSIRQMEAAGQTMGLNETLNTDLTSAESNNIDVHMMRTTEYGAVAILSASGFGNPKKLSEVSIKSSTGNVTGVYMGNRWEWTAGVCSASTVRKNARYYDLYTTSNTSAKVGDALGTDSTPNKGCTGWHGASGAYWLNSAAFGFRRGNNGVFSFDGGSNWTGSGYCGRGVAVVGPGL